MKRSHLGSEQKSQQKTFSYWHNQVHKIISFTLQLIKLYFNQIQNTSELDYSGATENA